MNELVQKAANTFAHVQTIVTKAQLYLSSFMLIKVAAKQNIATHKLNNPNKVILPPILLL